MTIIQPFEDGKVPDWFKTRLRHIDPALVCYFNPFKRQFVIDRCIHGQDCLLSDHSFCQKTTVKLIPHITEGALDDLKGMDAWTNFGGNDEAALLRFRRDHENKKAEWDAKQEEKGRELMRDGLREDRVQINKALALIQRHDVARPHK